MLAMTREERTGQVPLDLTARSPELADAELARLWARREALIASRPADPEAVTDAHEDALSEVEREILATPAAGLAGLLIKLRLGASMNGTGLRPAPAALAQAYARRDGLDDDRVILSCWADAERLIGAAPASAEAPGPDLVDLMGRRAAQLAGLQERGDGEGELEAPRRAEADQAIAEIYALQHAMINMMATTPAGAVQQIAVALGTAANFGWHDERGAEIREELQEMARLLVSALRVLLPVAGLKAGETLAAFYDLPDNWYSAVLGGAQAARH